MRHHRVPAMAARIGSVAASFGLTNRAIRFYEERGLICATRDSMNRRVFDDDARRRLEVIALLRRVRVPLPDIQQVLECEAGELARMTLALQKLKAQKALWLDMLADVDRLIQQLDGAGRSVAIAAE
jgi:DNA-binding transcriptional MerR regulator